MEAADVAGIMADPTRLNPRKPHQETGEKVDRPRLITEHEADGGREQKGHEREGEGGAVALAVEEAEPRELVDQAAVIGGDLRDFVVGEVAHVEAFEVGPGGGGMVGDEGVGGVLAGEVKEREIAAGVRFEPMSDIVDFALDADPEVGGGVVLAELRRGDEDAVAFGAGFRAGRCHFRVRVSLEISSKRRSEREREREREGGGG
ncbi:uncharacterized protein A4U43_UnF9020 [Asparagus officinalis]|uniref:Uncharacterized protein n=1 Tax=Asparagus officinalis TaxID=4686 RepID=A0A1R3L5S8_ASPOF|nr:uncharacterized protein A4U43_UnF9020 [Asparagus officinalis]